MKKHKVVTFFFISFFLCSSLTVQAASQPMDIGQKEKPGKLSPPPLPVVPGKAPRNKQTIKKTVVLPDLSISKLSASPKLVSSGDKVKLSADVKNSGKNTLKNVKVSFYNKKSKKKLGDDVIVIGGGKTKNAAITVPLKGRGTITIKAVVNPGWSIAESNKRNNEKTTHVSIKKPVMAKSHQKFKTTGSTPKSKPASLKIKPDLSPVTLKLDKNTVDVGKTVVAKVRVKNVGAKKMKNIPVSFFLGRKQIGTKKVSIPANSSSPVSFRYVAKKPGSYTFSAKVDPRNIIDERNERNNSANVKLQVNKPQLATIVETSARDNIRPNRVPGQLFKKRPDLLPTRIWVDDATCRLWVEWKNQGAAAPEKTFTERYSLQGNFRHGSNMMTSHSFDSGQLYAIGSPYLLNHGVTDLWEIVILGETRVTFTIDGTDVHTEINENNNTMEVDVTCATRIPNLGKFNMPGQIRTIDPDSLPPGLDQNGFSNPNTPGFNRNVQGVKNQMDLNNRKVDRGLPVGHGVSSQIGGVERGGNTPGGGFLDDMKNPTPNVHSGIGSHVQGQEIADVTEIPIHRQPSPHTITVVDMTDGSITVYTNVTADNHKVFVGLFGSDSVGSTDTANAGSDDSEGYDPISPDDALDMMTDHSPSESDKDTDDGIEYVWDADYSDEDEDDGGSSGKSDDEFRWAWEDDDEEDSSSGGGSDNNDDTNTEDEEDDEEDDEFRWAWEDDDDDDDNKTSEDENDRWLPDDPDGQGARGGGDPNPDTIKTITTHGPKGGGIRFVDGEEGGTTGGTPEGGVSVNPHILVNPGDPYAIDESNASFENLNKRLQDVIIEGGPPVRQE